MNLAVFGSMIRQVEKSLGYKLGQERTILVGDLNQNPFEDGVVAGEGLNAAMTRDVVARLHRKVEEQHYSFFYNPMWGHLGDSTHEKFPPGTAGHEPAGTSYYSAGESRWYYWNMFDQVMLRPPLLSAFKNEDLKILSGADGITFLNKSGRPDKDRVSDHLPILFRIDI